MGKDNTVAMPENERLRLLVDRLTNGNQKEFAEKTGISYTSINKRINGKGDKVKLTISPRFVQSVINAFPQVSQDWLMCGYGSPWVGDDNGNVKSEIDKAFELYSDIIRDLREENNFLKGQITYYQKVIDDLIRKS